MQWLPRPPRLFVRWRRSGPKASPSTVLDSAPMVVDGPGGGIVALAALVVTAAFFVVVLVLFVLPAVLLVVDVLLALLALVAVLGRVLLGRPWRVVARCTAGPSAGEEQVREVVGVRAARRARDDLRAAIAATG